MKTTPFKFRRMGGVVRIKNIAIKRKVVSALIFVIVTLAVVLYLYFDRNNSLSNIIRSLGIFGIFITIVVMSLVCVTPLPSEGLLILILKIYGTMFGIFYAWVGSLISTFIVFVLARYVGASILQSLITPKRFEQVDRWIQGKGTIGLLIVRLLPIPGFLTSYILGTMPSIRLWAFVWTAAVSIIPYYIGVACIFRGISSHGTSWISIGAVALILLWGTTHFVKKKWA